MAKGADVDDGRAIGSNLHQGRWKLVQHLRGGDALLQAVPDRPMNAALAAVHKWHPAGCRCGSYDPHTTPYFEVSTTGKLIFLPVASTSSRPSLTRGRFPGGTGSFLPPIQTYIPDEEGQRSAMEPLSALKPF